MARAQARPHPLEGAGQRRHVAGREHLARLAGRDEVGGASHAIADHAGQPRGERLVDHQAPGLSPVARQRETVRRGVHAAELGLIQEARPVQLHAELARLGAALRLQLARPDHEQAHGRIHPRDGPDEVQGALLGLELACEQHHEGRAREAEGRPGRLARLRRLVRGRRAPEELGVDGVRRVPDQRVPRPEAPEIGTRVVTDTEVPVEAPEQEPRPERPRPAPPIRGSGPEVRVTAIERGDPLPPACPERAGERDGMPAGDQGDVGPALPDGRGDLRNVEAPEAVAVHALSRPRGSKDPTAIPVGEWHVPLKRLSEARPLLLRRGLRRVEHGQVDVATARCDVAEPRGVVLDGMREDRREPDGPHGQHGSPLRLPRHAQLRSARRGLSRRTKRTSPMRRRLSRGRWDRHAKSYSSKPRSWRNSSMSTKTARPLSLIG